MSQCDCHGNESTKNMKPHACPPLRDDLRNRIQAKIATFVDAQTIAAEKPILAGMIGDMIDMLQFVLREASSLASKTAEKEE